MSNIKKNNNKNKQRIRSDTLGRLSFQGLKNTSLIGCGTAYCARKLHDWHRETLVHLLIRKGFLLFCCLFWIFFILGAWALGVMEIELEEKNCLTHLASILVHIPWLQANQGLCNSFTRLLWLAGLCNRIAAKWYLLHGSDWCVTTLPRITFKVQRFIKVYWNTWFWWKYLGFFFFQINVFKFIIK